jgi:hypothetical protein
MSNVQQKFLLLVLPAVQEPPQSSTVAATRETTRLPVLAFVLINLSWQTIPITNPTLRRGVRETGGHVYRSTCASAEVFVLDRFRQIPVHFIRNTAHGYGLCDCATRTSLITCTLHEEFAARVPGRVYKYRSSCKMIIDNSFAL